jgi:superfamily II DNA/RNA helicase
VDLNQNLAPGMRVVIRDAEWVIRRADRASDGGYQLTCDGISEIIRGQQGIFLSRLEDRIQVLDPAETTIISDDSSGYADSLLYMESMLRKRATNDASIQIAHQAAMNQVPYQLDPAVQALKQPRQRILIADAVGLGKTLEAGILTSELIHRGRGKRILVLAVKSMLTQFQKEFWNRFTIPLTRLDSIGLQRVRNRIPTNHNPFYYYDKTIISIDTLKQDSEYRVYLEQAYWDIIIIDECHNVADRGSGLGSSSQRARLAKLLSTRSDTLIMLSATPHDGRAKSFASLMNMLDPTAIADPEHYDSHDFSSKGLVIRRFKKDIKHQVSDEFRERKVYMHKHDASPVEESAYRELLAIPFTRNSEAVAGRSALLRVGLQKALFSSPAACLKSVAERQQKLITQQERSFSEDVAHELTALDELANRLEQIVTEQYGKYQALLELIKSKSFNWSARSKDDRLVIFSERIETLHFLHARLLQDLRLKEKQLQILHGGMSDVEQQEIVEAFGKPEEAVRILICSDVASEGINLHYLSHRLIHFDMPWSLMVFQQRNGRVDRYGQEHEPQIHYLLTESQNEQIRGDMRILEVLKEKDEQAYENIGDPSAFMGVYDVREEEKLTEQAMADGTAAERFDAQLQPKQDEGDDLLALFLGEGTTDSDDSQGTPVQVEQPETNDAETLFPSHYAWCKTALKQLQDKGEALQVTHDDSSERVSLYARQGGDLDHRFKFLPREVMPEDRTFVLTARKETIAEEVNRCRQDENAWPKQHYLWPQHPVVEWLSDRMQTRFGRHTAPVIELNQGMETDEVLFVVSGLIPNRKSHPLVHEWVGVRFLGDVCVGIETFADTLTRTGLGKQPLPNRRIHPDMERIEKLLWMRNARDSFEAGINVQLDDCLSELDKLRGRQKQRLEQQLNHSRYGEAHKASAKASREQSIDEIFDEYIQWVEDTMTTEPEAYIQVISVLLAGGADGHH